jgi:hypothetical protein
MASKIEVKVETRELDRLHDKLKMVLFMLKAIDMIASKYPRLQKWLSGPDGEVHIKVDTETKKDA